MNINNNQPDFSQVKELRIDFTPPNTKRTRYTIRIMVTCSVRAIDRPLSPYLIDEPDEPQDKPIEHLSQNRVVHSDNPIEAMSNLIKAYKKTLSLMLKCPIKIICGGYYITVNDDVLGKRIYEEISNLKREDKRVKRF